MHRIHFPWLAQGAPGPVAQGHPCGLTEPEAALLALIRNHPRQGRVGLACDPRLVAAAQHKAQRFRALLRCDHTVDGVSANRNLVNHRYDAGYALDANYVESYACGPQTPVAALDAWLGSPGHRSHVLGLTDWYAGQVFAGVGTAVSASGRNDIWVFVTAHPAIE